MANLVLENKILRESNLTVLGNNLMSGNFFLDEIGARNRINSLYTESITYMPLRTSDRDILMTFLDSVWCNTPFTRTICMKNEPAITFQALRLPNTLSETLTTNSRHIVKFSIIETRL